jgi:hypothetical protein
MEITMPKKSASPTPETATADDPKLSSIFRLAPLQAVDPDLLISGDDEVDGFVLALALAHNDIKAIHWSYVQLKKHRPPDLTEISPDLGEFNGMQVQIARWLIALTHEVIRLIARAKERKVLHRRTVKNAVGSIAAPYQRLWKELVAVSTRPSGPALVLRPYLRSLRNDAVFHYAYPDELMKGYRAVFTTDPKTTYNQHAYLSVGPTLQQTRFFFADTAAQRLYSGTEDLNRLFEQAQDFIGDLHHTLSGFVWGYMKLRHRIVRKSRA